MFVTPAYAQTGAGAPDMLVSILPFDTVALLGGSDVQQDLERLKVIR